MQFSSSILKLHSCTFHSHPSLPALRHFWNQQAERWRSLRMNRSLFFQRVVRWDGAGGYPCMACQWIGARERMPETAKRRMNDQNGPKKTQKRKGSASGFSACAREAILQSCRLPCGGWAGVPCPVPPVTGRHKVCTCKSDNSRKSGQFSFQMLVAGCAHAHLSAAFWNGPDQSLRGKQRRGFSRPGQASLPPRGPERKHGR